jgi:hypothetical protein
MPASPSRLAALRRIAVGAMRAGIFHSYEPGGPLWTTEPIGGWPHVNVPPVSDLARAEYARAAPPELVEAPWDRQRPVALTPIILDSEEFTPEPVSIKTTTMFRYE